MIYIKGTNFDEDASRNKVFVGDYACIIDADGTSQQQIACRTTPIDSRESVYSLPVTVESEAKSAVTCDSDRCRVNYITHGTPFIHEISPRSSVGGEQLTIWGAHEISDLGDGRSAGEGDIDYFLIGDTLCSIIDIDQD